MDTLRIILIAGGLALIVAIYLWDRIQSRRREKAESWQEDGDEHDLEGVELPTARENPFDDEWEVIPIPARRDSDDDDGLEQLKGMVARSDEQSVFDEAPAQAAQPEELAPAEEVPPADEEKVADGEVIVFSLLAEEGDTFNGMQLLEAMELCGLSHGEMGIFHYTDLDSNQPLFSVANILEPGSFDLASIGELETPGLALFMRLPAPIDGEKALLTFIQQAKRLREQLRGRLSDGQRRELSRERLDELKETASRYRVSAD